MSWLFSQALVGEYLAANCSNGELSVLSNGESTPQAYCAPDKMKGFSRLSRFGMMFKPLTANLGAELLMWYLAAFPVRTYLSQEKAQESTANAAECGTTWRGSLARFDRDSLTWKTAQRSLLGDSELSSVIWPRSGMTAAGQCWELPTLEPITREIDSGLWLPTPQARDYRSGDKPNSPRAIRKASAGWSRNLNDIVMLPTPYATDAGSGRINTSQGSSNQRPMLALMARKNLWPTPLASEGSGGGKAEYAQLALNNVSRESGASRSLKLRDAVKLWPTPKASEPGMSAKTTGRHYTKSSHLTMQVAISQGLINPATGNLLRMGEPTGGQLNPTWVEKLMGWPANWTSLEPINEEERTDGEVVREVQCTHDAAEVGERETGQHVCQPEILQHYMRWLSDHGQTRSGAQEGAATCPDDSLPRLRRNGDTAAPSHRPEPTQQRGAEHQDSLPTLPHQGSHAGRNLGPWGEGWEFGIPRVAIGVTARVDRLKAIGNGQVPLCAATAWRMLGGPVN